MNTACQYSIVDKAQKKSTEKLSSGYKINRAADNAAGLQISEKMRSLIRGLDQGTQNTEDGISWVQIADGSLNEIQSIIHRIGELSIYAANGTLSESDREAIDNEVQQLKKEIDQTVYRTKFNEIQVFDPDILVGEDLATMDVDGAPKDMNIFNASYDKVTGEVQWGGIAFRDQRISWNTINPNMVYWDSTDNTQKFHSGNYSFSSPDGISFSIHCEEGDTVPQFTRKISVSADKNGIYIDGYKMDWSDLKDENDVPCSEKNTHGGAWTLEYFDATITFTLLDETRSIAGMANAINSLNRPLTIYTWKTQVNDERTKELAVEIGHFNKLQITNDFLNLLSSSIDSGESPLECQQKADAAMAGGNVDPSHTHATYDPTDPNHRILSATALHPEGVPGSYSNLFIRAGQDPAGSGKSGIWLADGTGNTATAVNDSFRTWEDLGIKDWFDGPYIPGNIVYEYKSASGESCVLFDFEISKLASEDAVINALDGIELSGEIQTHYEMYATLNDPADLAQKFGLTNVSAESNVDLTFKEEIALQRDYSQKEDFLQQQSDVDYRSSTGAIQAEFRDTSSSLVTSFSGSANKDVLANSLNAKVATSLDYVESIISQGVINGIKQEDQPLIWTTDLRVLLGQDNVTQDTYLSEALDIKDISNRTKATDIILQPVASAHINFEKIGNSLTLDDLNNTGFSSSCMTCSNQYSFEFVDKIADQQKQYTQSNFAYSIIRSNDHYQLMIDIDSLKRNGVTDGEQLASALVEITDQCYDFHFTQYAAKDSTFYIYDERPSVLGGNQASFSTKPYINRYEDSFTISLNNNDGDQVQMTYTFDTRAIANRVHIEMAQIQRNALGQPAEQYDVSKTYYTLVDPSDPSKGYNVFKGNQNDWSNAIQNGNQIFSLQTKYFDGTGNAVSKADALSAFTKELVAATIDDTILSFRSTDYTYGINNTAKNVIGELHKANPLSEGNIAIGVKYDSWVDVKAKSFKSSGIMIQHSGEQNHSTYIPRFAMNTHVMHLSDCNTITQDNALITLDMSNYANRYVSSRRSILGALQNRFERTISNNQNTSENTVAAESRIRDTDMSQEMLEYSKQKILLQAGQSMIAQARQMPNAILSLIS